jgi:hypothetical protein
VNPNLKRLGFFFFIGTALLANASGL